MEVIISTFIFSLVVAVAMSVFASSFSAQKNARTEQRNLEEARTAMEMMAKNIRMSGYLVPSDLSAGGYKTIAMFNNSQMACLRYSFSGGGLTVEKYQFFAVWDPANDPPKCSNGGVTYDPAAELISIPADGAFSVVQTSAAAPEKIGKATILIKIGTGGESQNIQTTVSFRDYGEVL